MERKTIAPSAVRIAAIGNIKTRAGDKGKAQLVEEMRSKSGLCKRLIQDVIFFPERFF